MTPPITNVDKAKQHWPEPVPDWVLVLARECDRASQDSIAQRIGYSPAVVSGLIRCKYKGDLTAVETAVRGNLMDATVDCPVMGELFVDVCLDNQRRPRRQCSGFQIQMWHACRSCRHNHHGKEAGNG